MNMIANMVDKLTDRIQKKPSPPDFSAQLGLRAADFSFASDVVIQVAAGLQAIASRDFLMGRSLLTRDFIGDRSARKHLWPTTGKRLQISPSGRHAYVYTEILALIHAARSVGSLPPRGHLSWIKRLDPVLHRLLVEAGRPVSAVQCAGIVAHYLCEVAAGKPLHEPHIKAAQLAFDNHQE